VVFATDLSTLSVDELVKAFVETILFRKTIEHIGRRNRLIERVGDIERELTARDPNALNCLRELLQHSDREVRYHTAVAFKDIDRATCKKVLANLAKGKDDVGFEVRMFFDELIHGKEPEDVSYDDVRTDPGSAAAEAAWQPRHPPPATMSLAQIRRKLARTMSPEFAGRVQSLARSAIGLGRSALAVNSP
jgi:transposase